MGKGFFWGFAFLLLALGLLLFAALPSRNNAQLLYTLDYQSKQVYGCFIFDKLLKAKHPAAEFHYVQLSPSDYFNQKTSATQALERNEFCYVFVADYFDMPKKELEFLLEKVEKGATLFIAAKQIEDELLKLLSIRMEDESEELKKGLPFEWRIKESSTGTLRAKISDYAYGFALDSADYETIGSFGIADKLQTNLVRKEYGKGFVLLHANPTLLTNLFASNQSVFKLIDKMLNYFPPWQSIYMDQRYQPFFKDKQGKLDVLFAHPSFRIGLILLAITFVLFVFFYGKRMQKAIPIMEKPSNTTADFAKTLANLYLGNRNNKDLAQKATAQLLEWCRNTYFISKEESDEQVFMLLKERGELSANDWNSLRTYVDMLQGPRPFSDKELLSFVQLIQSIKQKRLQNGGIG